MKVNHRLDGPADAPVLVLSSSLGSTLRMWEPQLPELTRHFRVLRYDHRGHGGTGLSPEPYGIADLGRDVVELLDANGFERVSFCGLSLGGMVGMWLGAEAPERVDRLVLCCTSAHMPPPELWDERAAAARAGAMDSLADGAMERWFTAEFREREPETVARFRDELAATPPEGYAACCEAIRDWDFRDRLAAVAAPTLVVAAADDPSTPPAHGELVAARIPGARLVVIPQAAHLANVAQPARFTETILGHLLAA